jgi:ketosteroid isomerase-like protein
MDGLSEHAAITRTLTVYAWAYDEHDLDLLASCFTVDAVLLGPRRELWAEGRDGIREFFAGRRAGRAEAREQTRHLITNVLVEEQAGDVVVLSYVLVAVTGPGAQSGFRAGWYRDVMVESDGGWRLRERCIHLDSDADYEQVAFGGRPPSVDARRA